MLQFSFFSFAFENPFNLSHSKFILQNSFQCLFVKLFWKSSKLLFSTTSVFCLICTFDNDWTSSVPNQRDSQVTFHKREKIMNQYLFPFNIVVEFFRKNEIDEVYLSFISLLYDGFLLPH